MGGRRQEVVFRGDLLKAYQDPPHCSWLLAYSPEVHASSKCERAIRGGSRINVGLTEQLWCASCTTAVREEATVRWDGEGWYPTVVADPEVSD